MWLAVRLRPLVTTPDAEIPTGSATNPHNDRLEYRRVSRGVKTPPWRAPQDVPRSGLGRGVHEVGVRRQVDDPGGQLHDGAEERHEIGHAQQTPGDHGRQGRAKTVDQPGNPDEGPCDGQEVRGGRTDWMRVTPPPRISPDAQFADAQFANAPPPDTESAGASDGACLWREVAGNRPHQGRLAGTVGTDERHLCALTHAETRITEQASPSGRV